MLRSLDAKDSFVRTKVDLDHHVLLRHLLEQCLRIVLVHHVDAVADALRVPVLDSLTDVEAKPFRRNEPRGQFTGM